MQVRAGQITYLPTSLRLLLIISLKFDLTCMSSKKNYVYFHSRTLFSKIKKTCVCDAASIDPCPCERISHLLGPKKSLPIFHSSFFSLPILPSPPLSPLLSTVPTSSLSLHADHAIRLASIQDQAENKGECQGRAVRNGRTEL